MDKLLGFQVLRKALKISRPLSLMSGEVPRFHGGLLWHSTLEQGVEAPLSSEDHNPQYLAEEEYLNTCLQNYNTPHFVEEEHLNNQLDTPHLV